MCWDLVARLVHLLVLAFSLVYNVLVPWVFPWNQFLSGGSVQLPQCHDFLSKLEEKKMYFSLLCCILIAQCVNAAKIAMFVPTVSQSVVMHDARIDFTLMEAGHEVVLYIPRYRLKGLPFRLDLSGSFSRNLRLDTLPPNITIITFNACAGECSRLYDEIGRMQNEEHSDYLNELSFSDPRTALIFALYAHLMELGCTGACVEEVSRLLVYRCSSV